MITGLNESVRYAIKSKLMPYLIIPYEVEVSNKETRRGEPIEIKDTDHSELARTSSKAYKALDDIFNGYHPKVPKHQIKVFRIR